MQADMDDKKSIMVIQKHNYCFIFIFIIMEDLENTKQSLIAHIVAFPRF